MAAHKPLDPTMTVVLRVHSDDLEDNIFTTTTDSRIGEWFHPAMLCDKLVVHESNGRILEYTRVYP